MATSTPCFFGLTNVRVCTRVIAYVNFWAQLFYISRISISTLFRLREDTCTKTDNQWLSTVYDMYQSDMSPFNQISACVLIMYACFYLKKSTYSHNIQFINFWMVLTSVNCIALVSFVIFTSFRNENHHHFYYLSIIESALECYKLYIVYQFYLDEISLDRVNVDRNNKTQNSTDNAIHTYPENHTVVIGTDNAL